jgi:hypothetical protein
VGEDFPNIRLGEGIRFGGHLVERESQLIPGPDMGQAPTSAVGANFPAASPTDESKSHRADLPGVAKSTEVDQLGFLRVRGASV